MKKILYILTILSFTIVNAQEIMPSDVFRFSLDELNGTARFRALSGAFGAVGGDISSLNVNPAGSIYFNVNTFSASLNNYNTKNEATYFGTKASENDSKLSLNQAGVVFPFTSSDGNKWNKISIGFTYENVANLSNEIFVNGLDPSNTIGTYFYNKAQGIELYDLELQAGETYNSLYQYLGENINFDAQQAMLAYNTYIINPVANDPANTAYTLNMSNGSFNHKYYNSSTGYNGKITGNFAAQYDEKLSIGFNINAYFFDIQKLTTIIETNTNNPINGVQSIKFENDLYSRGSGVSLDFGAILKLNNYVRVGASYTSPTWYEINDELMQSLTVSSVDTGVSYTDVISPNITNVYEPYKIKTPSKITFSGVVLLDKKGFLSIDYGIKDYTEAIFKPKADSYFSDLNKENNSVLTKANSLAIGGEYKIDKLSLRGGYRSEESPYKNGKNIGELKGYSAGLGYDFGEYRLDLAYSTTERVANEALISSGMNDAAQVNALKNNITLTYTLKF